MIAVDSNILISALKGIDSAGATLLRLALADRNLVIPPPVVTEVLSFPVQPRLAAIIAEYRTIDISDGFWERVAKTRRSVLSRGLRAKLPDTLIAQCCIDADVALITDDTDFRHFETHCGLKLAL